MSFPHELTFGVFDAASRETVVSNPVLWVWQVHAKDGKLFASLIDGGSALTPSSEDTRYLLRSMAPRQYVVDNEATIQRGHIIQLLDYTWRRVAGKNEIIFVIFKLHVVSKDWVERIDTISRKCLQPYPHETAPQKLAALHPPSRSLAKPQEGDLASIQQGAYAYEKHQSLYPSLDSPPQDESFVQERPSRGLKNSCDGEEEHQETLKRPSDRKDSGATLLREARVAPYPAKYKASGAIARRHDGPFLEIKNLSSFLGCWTVKGRFINKNDIRTYSNARGEGKLFTCELIDSREEHGTISCTFFNKAVDKFFQTIKENEIYLVSRGLVRAANRKFNSSPHPFELQLGEDAEIQWIAANDPTIPTRPTPTITPILDVMHLSKQAFVTICGILIKLSEPTQIITRMTEQPRLKRELSLVDQSGASIDVTLWGSKAQVVDTVDLDHASYVLLIEGARVDEYNGRKLSCLNQTQIRINPDIPETQALKNWYNGKKGTSVFTSLTTSSSSSWNNDAEATERLTIAALREQAVKIPEREWEDRGRFFSCVATLISIEHDRQFYWSACPKCGKKVMPVSDNMAEELDEKQSEAYTCPGCATAVLTPVRKYLLNVVIADTTGSLRCLAMGDRGHLIMGSVTPDLLIELQASPRNPSDYQHFEDYFFQRLRREYVFKLHAKSETYRDETRVRYRIIGLDSLNGIVSSDSPQAPNGLATCRTQMVREAKKALHTIYSRITRE